MKTLNLENLNLENLDLENLDPDSPEFLQLVRDLSHLPQCAWAFKDLDEETTVAVQQRAIKRIGPMLPGILALRKVMDDPEKKEWLEKNMDKILNTEYSSTEWKDILDV